jgi:isopenicillin N synthase-like dioxygenase
MYGGWFYYLLGHSVSKKRREGMFTAVRAFHNLPDSEKEALQMDRAGWPVGGVGYLPLHHRKLPSRNKGNANEAFIVKRQSRKMKVELDTDNQWPTEKTLPGFRQEVKAYAECMEKLALCLLPLYARVLKVDPYFFKQAFTSPMYRLRMTKYPPLKSNEADEFGIGPHVDTSFFTLLDQDMKGLIIYSEKRQRWLRAPYVEGALIVNTGEMLKAWTNDRFPSVKHYATHIVRSPENSSQPPQPRYSIPFFFNADADFRMHCIPTCCSADETPKYPPFSYSESQALAQGE